MGLKGRIQIASSFVIACILLLSPTPGQSQKFDPSKAKAQSKEEKIPADLAPEKVDSFLAGLSDEQARRLLASELKAKAVAKSEKDAKDLVGGSDPAIVQGFFAAQTALSSLSDQLSRSFAGAHTSAETDIWERLVGGKGVSQFLIAIGLLVLIILMGVAAERLLLRATEKIRMKLLDEIPRGGWEKAGVFLSKLILDAFGLLVYVLITFLAYFVIYGQSHPAFLVSSAVILTYYFRLFQMGARLIISPKAPELRLAPMSDSDARTLYNGIIWIAASVLPVSTLALALRKSEASHELFLFVYSTAGPIVSVLLAIMIWRVRHRVAQAFCPLESSNPMGAMSLRRRCADYWHIPAILFALMVGGYWWARALTHADVTIARLILSLFLVPLCVGADQWLQQMFKRLSRKAHEIIDFSAQHEIIDFSTPDEEAVTSSDKSEEEPSPKGSKATGKDMSLYFPLIRKTFRIVLLLFVFFAVLELWGIEFDVGWIFARSVLGVILALVLGIIFWEVVKVRIDQRIAEEMPLGSEEAEEGGSGGSRSGTLLLLLRKFIMVFLFIVVGFSILSSLGVNIAPLLAGAGVVGLAIGFGSQTLVKDIISGVFFLIDDAFRVGDYVEAGTAKGTVEQISLRSLRLRHPRGQIFVVPFGDLKMVQNFTRDYIIEKLDIRVRYDTDPDEIRKIVKKINKEIKGDEEMARFLLSDVKSVGVRAMDDSAMIMRVKFKCIPGEQFIIRRQVFHRLQKAFKEKGIEFAHRNVTVYLPPQPGPVGSASQGGEQSIPAAAAGAAAAAAIAQAEAEALAKLAPKDKPE